MNAASLLFVCRLLLCCISRVEWTNDHIMRIFKTNFHSLHFFRLFSRRSFWCSAIFHYIMKSIFKWHFKELFSFSLRRFSTVVMMFCDSPLDVLIISKPICMQWWIQGAGLGHVPLLAKQMVVTNDYGRNTDYRGIEMIVLGKQNRFIYSKCSEKAIFTAELQNTSSFELTALHNLPSWWGGLAVLPEEFFPPALPFGPRLSARL